MPGGAPDTAISLAPAFNPEARRRSREGDRGGATQRRVRLEPYPRNSQFRHQAFLPCHRDASASPYTPRNSRPTPGPDRLGRRDGNSGALIAVHSDLLSEHGERLWSMTVYQPRHCSSTKLVPDGRLGRWSVPRASRCSFCRAASQSFSSADRAADTAGYSVSRISRQPFGYALQSRSPRRVQHRWEAAAHPRRALSSKLYVGRASFERQRDRRAGRRPLSQHPVDANDFSRGARQPGPRARTLPRLGAGIWPS